MKKIFMLLAFMTSVVSAVAQGEVGSFNVQPKVGMNISHFVGRDVSHTPRIGLNAGIEWEYQFANRVSLSMGLSFSMQGGKGKYNFVEAIVFLNNFQNVVYVGDFQATLISKMNYFQLPVMANVYVVKGLALKVGVQGGLNVRADYKLTISTSQGTVKEKGTLSDLGIDVNDFTLSIPVGLSYEYRNFVIEGRYNIGITKNFKNMNGRNNVFQLTMGKKFGR